MLRIKRSVQAQYNTDAGYVAAATAQTATLTSNGDVDESDPMAALERIAPLPGFVESSSGPVGGGVKQDTREVEVEDTNQDNPDAIELGDDDDMDED